MKILFLTADLGGNVPPTLAIADELARRNAQVEVAGLAPGRASHAQPVFRPALATMSGQGGQGLAKTLRMLSLMVGRTTSAPVEHLIAACQADIAVVDCMLPAALRGALRAGAPVAVLFHTVGEYWIHVFDGGAVGMFFSSLGLSLLFNL